MEGNSPKELAQRIKEYGKIIDYILIDPSGGRGEPFEIKRSVQIHNTLKEVCSNQTLGFAEG